MARRKFDINELPSNNLEPVDNEIEIITTDVKTRKPGLANNIRDIGNSLFSDIVGPTLKSLILDFFNAGLRQALFGPDSAGLQSRHTPYSTMHRPRQRVTYNRREPRPPVQQTEEIFEDVYFEYREDAQLVLGRMMERIAEYGRSTIGDLHSMTGLSSNYTYERYGWTDLQGCRILHTSDGYVIDFPEPVFFR